VPMDRFEHFVAQRKKDLARIARRTTGECEFEDVVGEAFLMAAEIGRRREYAVDWSSRTEQEQVLAYFYQKLVRYEERTVRFAVRLDKSEDDENSDFVHPLVGALASDGGRDPLAVLVEREIQQASRADQRNCHFWEQLSLLEDATVQY
jgi:hypothetical protein